MEEKHNIHTKKITNLLRWLSWIIVVYVLIGAGMYFFQERIIFQPTVLSRNYQYHFMVPFKEIETGFSKTDTMNMVKFFPSDSVRKGVVLYFHGNRANIKRYEKFARNFTNEGYEVWMPDYPGYGKSTGERTEKKLYEQSMYLFRSATAEYKNNQIILYGKSLGTGIAAYVAANVNCKELMLETPYYSFPDLMSTWIPIYPHKYLSAYKLPVNEYLQKVKCRVTIFQGTNDWVVPYRCAIKLKPFLKPSDEFITIKGGTHKNLNDYSLYHQKLDSLLQLP